MNVLVIAFGKGKKESGNRYMKAGYRFSDGFVFESSFFGLALHNWLKHSGTHIDRIVILGTSGSSWDALLEHDDCNQQDIENLYLELNTAVENDSVSDALLHKLSPYVSTAFKTDVVCTLISDAMDMSGQFSILETIASNIPVQSRVWMDITHSFRHLPLLELFSALNLEESADITIGGIFYGMYEKKGKDGLVPAVELAFIQEMSRWTRAMHTVSYGQLGALIGLPGMESFNNDLKRLIIYEQLNQTTEAKRVAERIFEGLQQPDALSGAAGLYRARLLEHFRWSKEQSYLVRQFKSAERAIHQHDYLRGIILLNETLITKVLPSGSDILSIDQRKMAADSYCTTDEHHRLRGLRNLLAHGTRPTGKHAGKLMTLIGAPDKFEAEILRLLEFVRREIQPS